ncbi:MAG: putative porin [Sulfuricella sp.]|jgi:hypothetical protein
MKSTNRKHYVRAAVIGLGVAASLLSVQQGTALATEESFDSTAAAIIKLLKEKNIITDAEAKNILSRQKQAPVGQLSSPSPVTVVVPEGQQYLQTVTDTVARDIKDEVKQEVKLALKDEIAREVKLEAFTGSVPAWTKRIRFGGDVRLRYQGDFFDKANDPQINYPTGDGTELMNSLVNRNRVRYRVRIAANAKVNNQTEVGVRLASGSSGDPISTNDTLGDYMNKDSVNIDQAYLKWSPIPESLAWTGEWNIWGGRMPNPFFSSDLVWDSDINLEGVATTLKVPINARWKGLFNAGAFPLQESEFSSDDKWLYGGQVGVEYAPQTTFNFTLAAAYYGFENIQGKRNPTSTFDVGINDYTVPLFQQKGNVVFDINDGTSADTKFALASKYNEVNITSTLDLGFWDPVHVVLLADYVKNLGFDQEEVSALTGTPVPKEDTGYQVGLTVGYPKLQKLWDWQTYLFYKYLEADAVLDAFTDSDFHLGGTNAEGWILGGQLGVGDGLWVNTRWITTNETFGVPFAIDTLQVDLNGRF